MPPQRGHVADSGWLCIVWATTILAIFARWRRKRKWLIAFTPMALFAGFCLHAYLTNAPTQWLSDFFPEDPPASQ